MKNIRMKCVYFFSMYCKSLAETLAPFVLLEGFERDAYTKH